MAAGADGYTRTVNALKVVLPLGALGLLSTLFLFSGEIDPTQSIPYAELNVEQLAREQRVTAPYFAGVTEDGVAVTLTGSAVVPDLAEPSRVTVQDLAASLQNDTQSVDATAPAAAIDTNESTALLTGGAQVQSSDGLIIDSAAIKIDLTTGDLQTLGPIEAEGPFGTLRADRMEMVRPAPDAPHRIVFEGGVRLVYQDGSE